MNSSAAYSANNKLNLRAGLFLIAKTYPNDKHHNILRILSE